jgi:hypothetical protein
VANRDELVNPRLGSARHDEAAHGDYGVEVVAHHEEVLHGAVGLEEQKGLGHVLQSVPPVEVCVEVRGVEVLLQVLLCFGLPAFSSPINFTHLIPIPPRRFHSTSPCMFLLEHVIAVSSMKATRGKQQSVLVASEKVLTAAG